MRITNHNGRKGKDGVFSAKHNDRNFDLKNARHIDAEKTKDNWNIRVMKDAKTNDECERLFYEKHFSKMLEERNQRYIDQRHSERCQSIDSYRQNEKFCPEETIYMIGNKDTTVDAQQLKECFVDLMKYESEKYPQVKYTCVNLHQDEQGAPHIHARKVWIAHDKNGNETVSQNKSLQEMGVQRPDPEREQSRYNNPKMTYTRDIRDKFVEICRSRGLEIETQPLEKSKTGLDLQTYKTRQEEERAQMYQERTEGLKNEVLDLERDKTTLNAEKEQIKAEIEPQKQEIAQLHHKKEELTGQVDKLHQQAQKERDSLTQTRGWKEFIKRREEVVVMDVDAKAGIGGTKTNLSPQQVMELAKDKETLNRMVYDVQHGKEHYIAQGRSMEKESQREKNLNSMSDRLSGAKERADLSNENQMLKKALDKLPENVRTKIIEEVKLEMKQSKIKTHDIG